MNSQQLGGDCEHRRYLWNEFESSFNELEITEYDEQICPTDSS
jgi:hypothetical protein